MSDKKFPNPEDVQKEFEDFVKKRFGGSVQVFSHSMQGNGEQEATTEKEENLPEANEDHTFSIDFDMKPKDVKDHLDKYIIKQDEAKRALSIAICDHYNHVKFSLKQKEEANTDKIDYAKQNILILGPTGVGKTYMVRKVAELIGVPFVKADATRFSETGYVGSNVDDIIRDLVSQADGNIEKAQYGIVYLDEVDKLSGSGGAGNHGRDVTGRGVQFGLLKLMEETEVDLRSGNDMQSQIQAMMDFQRGKTKKSVVNTGNILFIVSGAFTGLEDIVKKRLKTNHIGFASGRSDRATPSTDDLLAKATTQDLVDYGFEPEFVGRLPVQVACQHLNVTDLFNILKESKGSILKQYHRAFAAYDIDINFTDEALLAISEKAAKHKTGARALMSVCENILRDYKFELPSSHVVNFDVTKAVVQEPKKVLEDLLATPNNSALNHCLKSVLAFEESFEEQHNLKIIFSQEAAEALAYKALESGLNVKDICEQQLLTYEHGLKLIQQSTGETEFTLGKEVVDNPKGLLEKLIAEAFASQQPVH